MNPSDHMGGANVTSHTAPSSLKEKAAEQVKMFLVVAAYLAVMLIAFEWYRRFILQEAPASVIHHGAAVIEALILGKVVLIGQDMHLGKRYEGSPLFLSVLFKSLVFAVFIALFGVVEHLVEGLVHRDSWDQIAHKLVSVGRDEFFARAIMAAVTLIPFFAFVETDRVMGDHKLFGLFFRRRAA